MKRGFLALAIAACSSDPPPSCQQAMTHYYGSGCELSDLSTTPPTPYSLNESITDCKAINNVVPDRCQAEFDELLICFDSTPATATSNSDCDCSQEQDALSGCQ